LVNDTNQFQLSVAKMPWYRQLLVSSDIPQRDEAEVKIRAVDDDLQLHIRLTAASDMS
jgi:hypothetical protein